MNEDLETSRDTARRNLYAAHMNLVQLKWNANDVEGVEALLRRQLPRPGEEDLRGFEWYYFARLSQASTTLPLDTSEEIFAVAASRDGQWLAAGGRRGIAYVWDAGACDRVRSMNAHQTGRELYNSSWIRSIDFSPDGQLVASAANLAFPGANHEYTRVQEVCLWRTATGELLRRIAVDSPGLRQVAFAADGRSVFVLDVAGIVTRTDIESGETLWSYLWPDSTGLCHVECSRCGRFFGISSDGDDGRVRIFSTETHAEVAACDGAEFAFQASGDCLASVLWSEEHQAQVVQIVDVPSGRRQRTLQRYAEDTVSRVRFSPSGELVAAAVGNVIQVWKIESGELLATWRGHRGAVGDLVFSADGARLISCGADGGVRSCRTVPESEVTALETSQESTDLVAFSAGCRLLCGSDAVRQGVTRFDGDRTVVWDVASGRQVFGREHPAGPPEYATISRDGDRVAVGGPMLLIHSVSGAAPTWEAPAVHEVRKSAFSPDEAQVAAFDHGELRLFDAASGELLRSLAYTTGEGTCYVNALAFSPDGRYLAAGGDASVLDDQGTWASPGLVKVWDTTTWDEVLVRRRPLWSHLDGDGPSVVGLAFSPDSRRIATIDDGLTLSVFDLTTGEEVFARRGHRLDDQFSFHHALICYDPTGARIVTYSYDVKLWDARSGEELLTIPSVPRIGADVIGFDESGETLFIAQSARVRRIRAPRSSAAGLAGEAPGRPR